jgi:hypothetical protein
MGYTPKKGKGLSDKDREKMVGRYMSMPYNQWPKELFWYVQGYCGAVGACGDVICSAIDQWFQRRRKNRQGTE